MNATTALSVAFAVLVAAYILLLVLSRRSPCTCGRQRPWVMRGHPVLPIAMAHAVLTTVITAVEVAYAVVDNAPVPSGDALLNALTIVGWGAFVPATWWVVWVHIRNRLRRAARALGRVVATTTGRLVVQHEPGVAR